MTPEQFKAEIKKRFEELKGGELILPVVQALVPRIADRIFIDGLNSSGSKIGNYSTSPMYVSPKQFHNKSGFRAIGKPTKDGKPRKKEGRKTMYLPGGYKQLRAVQGDKSDSVNLNYRGLLHTDFVSHIAINGNYVEVRLARETSRKKVEGNEKRFGSIFKLTKQEREFYVKETGKVLTKIMNN